MEFVGYHNNSLNLGCTALKITPTIVTQGDSGHDMSAKHLRENFPIFGALLFDSYNIQGSLVFFINCKWFL